MRDCQQCGEQNQASARFCVACGTPLSGTPGAVEVLPAPEPAEQAPALDAAGAAPELLSDAGGSEAPPESDRLDPRPVAHSVPSADLAPNSEDEGAAVGPRILVGFLVSYETVDIGQYWPLHQGRNVLGRQGAATGLDIEVAHPTISSLHAVLLASAQPARVVLEDTNSTNGTFLNEAPLAPGQRCELRDGDRVRFGLFNTIIKVIQP
jgi:hypothetical protein